jgi:Glycosyltransferase family 87
VTRAVLLLGVLGLLPLGGLGLTTDVKVIYQGWAQVLATGTFPLDDMTWQYPPLAALVMLLPRWLPWSYFTGFLALVLTCDALATWLLLRARRRGGSGAGVWLWVLAVPLLGPTVLCRFDLVVTVVAVAGLLAAARRPALGGALAGVGAMLKVWPVLTVLGAPRGRRTRDALAAVVVSALALGFVFAVTMNGAFSFLGFQEGRGVEVESLGALPFEAARPLGWHGRAAMNYGSVEMLGSGVALVGTLMVALSAGAFGWLLLWRARARRWTAATPPDAALTALLLFVVTSRVISPQYLVWLVGLAAVCLTSASTSQRPVAWLVLAACPFTFLEFPLLFADVMAFRPLGSVALVVRNLLLLAAALLSCRRLWRETVSPERARVSAAPRADRLATAR